jgi:cytochrome c peroxidase
MMLLATASYPGLAQVLCSGGQLPAPDPADLATIGALSSQYCLPGQIPGPNLSCVLLPANMSDFVVDMQAAKVLGKALFWDQQAGSDGNACASCHFHAGADNRVQNTLNPGLRNVDPARQNVWNLTASNRTLTSGPPPGGGPNYLLKLADFPFHQLSDPTNRNSALLFDTDDVVSSQGVFRADFSIVNLLGGGSTKSLEVCNPAASPTFQVGSLNTRQVEPRNTPTVINAIFNYRNFWDGRANNIFNGRNPFGPRDPTAGIDPRNSVVVGNSFGQLVPIPVAIPDASLASQAVGPPGSDLEMSCRGRSFEMIGRKMLQVAPLASQAIDGTDSLLGPYASKSANGNGNGLNTTYAALIRKAFQPKFWSAPGFTVDGFTQMEKNFSLFWGLAVMLYESTLVSDQSPFDQYKRGNITALTDSQVHGLKVLEANCAFCHKGPEFTNAASLLRRAAVEGD